MSSQPACTIVHVFDGSVRSSAQLRSSVLTVVVHVQVLDGAHLCTAVFQREAARRHRVMHEEHAEGSRDVSRLPRVTCSPLIARHEPHVRARAV